MSMTRYAAIALLLSLVLTFAAACSENTPYSGADAVDRVVLKGSTEGGNAIPIRFVAPELASSGLGSLTLRFIGAVTPTSPVFSSDVKLHYATPTEELVVPVTPKARQEILLPLPAERFYALDFEWPTNGPALSAEGRDADGHAISLDLQLRGVLRFRFLLDGLYIADGSSLPHWLIVMDPGVALPADFLARLKAEDDGSLRIDATHNAELQEEAARLVLAHFVLFNDPNRDGVLSLEERSAENRLAQGAAVDVLSVGAPCVEASQINGSCTRITSGSTEGGSDGFRFCALDCDPLSHRLTESCNEGIVDVGYCHPYLCQDGWLAELTLNNGEACGSSMGGPIQEGYGCGVSGVCEPLCNAGTLRIEPTSTQEAPIDFGFVQVGQHASRSIVLHNEGAKNLTILSLAWAQDSAPDYTSDTDAVAIPSPENQTLTIKPGESFPLNIGLSMQAGDAPRRATLRIASTDCAAPSQLVYFTTSSFGTTTINVAPMPLDFGSVAVGTMETRAFYVKNVVPAACDPTLNPPPSKPCNKAIGVSNFKVGGQDSSQFSIVSAVPITNTDPPHYITPGQTYEVRVAFHPTIANGQGNPIFDAYVTFDHDADINPYGEKHEAIKVALSGTGVVPTLCASPEAVIFNQIPFGTASTQSVKLTDCGGAPLIITAIDWDANYTKPAGCELSLQGSVGTMLDATQFTFFMVFCTPPTLNPQSGFITVTWNDDFKVSIPISYTVVADQILIEPAGALDFGPVKVGDTKSGFVRITNQGGSSVTILSATTVTNNANEFSLTEDSKAKLPKVLNANQYFTLELTYSPKVQQTVQTSGTLSILTSSPSMPKKDLILIGTPLWPICDFRLVEDDLLVSPNGTIDFGQVVTNTSATRKLRIDNTAGTTDCEVPLFALAQGSDAGFSFTPPIIPSVPAGTYYDIQIGCTPPTEGLLQATLNVRTNDLRPEIGSFSISLTCSGVLPALQVEPSNVPIELGSVGPSECGSPVAVTLRNIGTGTLKLCRPSALNDGWGQSTAACQTAMGDWSTWPYSSNGSGTREEGDNTCYYLRRITLNPTDEVRFNVSLCGCNESFPEGSTTPKSVVNTYNIITNDPAISFGVKTLSFHGEIHP